MLGRTAPEASGAAAGGRPPLPGRPGLWIAGGGYRAGIGIAHAVADALVAEITGAAPPIPLPDAFRPADG
jgi:glycine/D-amino acid oxidase-like deaminating enzyme